MVSKSEAYTHNGNAFVVSSENVRAARVGHRVVTLPDNRLLITGGSTMSGLTTQTAIMTLRADGSGSISDGPPLAVARRDHAAVVAAGVPVVIGGFGAGDLPLDTLEALQPGDATFKTIGQLRVARADATATVLPDGSILVAGGLDVSGKPRDDAEIFNPITDTTTVEIIGGRPRHGHTATLISGGRVLIVGGLDDTGQPLTSVELFVPDVGFVPERPLGVARAGHVAVPLCDDTVLIAGGGVGAEVYTLPAR
jgi:hypothetical protein